MITALGQLVDLVEKPRRGSIPMVTRIADRPAFRLGVDATTAWTADGHGGTEPRYRRHDRGSHLGAWLRATELPAATCSG